MLLRKLRAVLVAILMVFTVFVRHACAQSVEGEVFVGGEAALAKNDSASTTRGSFALGGGLSWAVASTGSVDLRLHTFPMFCFGTNRDGDFDITQFHLPLGMLVRFGETAGRPEQMTIGGGVGGGYMYSAGMLATRNADLRPYVEVEIMLRLFKRGLLKIRYNTVFGPYTDALGSSISYHTFCIIGSTSW